MDHIEEALWSGSDAPSNSAYVRYHVWALRAQLEPHRRARDPGSVVAKEAGGYLVRCELHEFDVDEADRLIEQAWRASCENPQTALSAAGAALRLWRGEALQDFRYDDFAQAEIRRLGGQRIEAERIRVDALFALGRGQETVTYLQGLTRRYPSVEPFWVQLVEALRASGRTAEARQTQAMARHEIEVASGYPPSERLGG